MHITEPAVTLQAATDMGLTKEEFEQIQKLLGRMPNFTELNIFSVMWSEHCSYKNSIYWLKNLPRQGQRVLVEAGEENAGLVDIGNGWACAFKIESHNHPSTIEPYQGASTGVGGIHRDIFAIGARPVAALSSLYFGNIEQAHTRQLIRGVVKEISDYGNSFGVPTIGGELYLFDCYNQSIVVNALSAGAVKIGETISARAEGPGNPVFIVGSATGKDGIHGASFASADIREDAHENLPSVQVGDPFQEKLLLEASLEAIQSGAVVGMQDMGAAGLCCSTAEMSARSKTGMRIDLEKAPTLQDGMRAFEILLSESLERMLIVGKKGMEHRLCEIFEKWDLSCEQIGEVTDSGRLMYYLHGELMADLPAEALVIGGGAPVYQREYSKPSYLQKIAQFRPSHIHRPENLKQTALRIAQSPNVVSRRWIYEQFGSTVHTNSPRINPPSDATIVQLKGTNTALALTVDCNPAYVYADPYAGTMIAVAEAARNIVCSGGEPLAITNGLNFGNPYSPEVYWQFVQAIKGMGDACRKFDIPVTGDKVSFYNQSVVQDRVEPIYPTPIIGMLGIVEDLANLTPMGFPSADLAIYMIGTPGNDMGSSEYLRIIHGVQFSPAPRFDLDEEYHIQQNIKALIKRKLLVCAHDISEGGLFIALLECALVNNIGFSIETDGNFRKDAYLFGEAQSRIVVGVLPENEDELVNYLNSHNVSFTKLGETIEARILVDEVDFGTVAEWKNLSENWLTEKMERD